MESNRIQSGTEDDIHTLKRRIEYLEGRLRLYEEPDPGIKPLIVASSERDAELPLPLQDYRRYGRQMILDGFGLAGQLKLQKTAILVVGAGGLGCPAIQYLAAAGIGKLGIVDHDVVELSNLQRQILHSDATIGMPKVDSCKLGVQRINPRVEVVTYNVSLTPLNAKQILSNYDVVLDCTDNLPTRYLISDITASTRTPLVSGGALKYDGQLAVYNYGEDGPCFRCVFPKPPPKDAEGSCEESGVLGVVTGVIGTLQAMEAIKLIVGLHEGRPNLLVFSALAISPFRQIKLRPKRPQCIACSPVSMANGTTSNEIDYVAFCGGEDIDWKQSGMTYGEHRITAKELRQLMQNEAHQLTIIDVRSPAEFSICNLPGSKNIPLRQLLKTPSEFCAADETTVFVCRLGNDSQIAVQVMRNVTANPVKDLIGGLRQWSEMDSTFPVY
ncbi:Urmylation protein [Tulasnella sp. 418]|nr:Urmylation protein [Tulasnella sp. 418]